MNKAIFLMGPTAAGKTGLAMTLVDAFARQSGVPKLEVISVDSAQVYRDMNIGTAKPSAAELRRVPHRLVDICDPRERYSAAQFRKDALDAMADITGKGNVPLLTGGTMLYFSALEFGLSAMPEADPTVRRRLEKRAEAGSWLEMHKRLKSIDPAAAARIHPNDPQRILRALEVFEITGKPISELQQRKNRSTLPFSLLKVIISPQPRERLHQRIEQRLWEMLASGLVEEVAGLKAQGLSADLPSMRAVGYRQVWDYLEGRITEAELPEKILYATRQLAKRQLTWMRKQTNAVWIDPETESAVEELSAVVGRFNRSSPTAS